MKLTKTQIGYFQERVNTIKRRVVEAIQCGFTVPEPMSGEEKLEMIASGAAGLRYDELLRKVRDKQNHWGPGGLFDAYDFPGECQRREEIRRAEERRGEVIAEVDRFAARICDDFVLGRIEDVDVALSAFENSADVFLSGKLPA